MTILNDDLLKEISQRELLELSDLDATGATNQEVVDDAITDALSFIGSFFKLPNNPTPLLLNIGVKLSIIELKKRNGWRENKEEMDRLEVLLLKMANKKLPIQINDDGDTPAPTPKNRAFRHHNKKALNLKGMQWQN
ncbi:MAG: phage protein Gp36 family protein [Campylobacteraceae bacterium]